jgi:cyclopropane-fatty-acyl-phospholipid synthase
VGFEDGGIGIHQVLGVVPTSAGESGMPATRRDWS